MEPLRRLPLSGSCSVLYIPQITKKLTKNINIMTPYKQSIEAAKSWKEAVGAMWKRQRLMLFLSIAAYVLLFIGLPILIGGIFCLEESVATATPLIITGTLSLLAMIPLAVTIIILMWVFYFDVRKWHKAAPESLKKSIKLLQIGVLITLIAALGGTTFSGFATIPYIGVVAQLLNSACQAAAYAGVILQFISVIKLRKAQDMPALGQKGAKSIFINYIVSFATAVFGSIVMIAALATLIVNLVDGTTEDNDIDEEVVNISTIWNTEDDEFTTDDTYELEFDDSVFLETLAEEAVNDEELAILKEFADDNEEVFGAFILALIIMITGSIFAMYFYYRGWWLISKSELEVLPEPIKDETSEEVAFKEVEEVEEAVVVENEETDTNQ